MDGALENVMFGIYNTKKDFDFEPSFIVGQILCA